MSHFRGARMPTSSGSPVGDQPNRCSAGGGGPSGWYYDWQTGWSHVTGKTSDQLVLCDWQTTCEELTIDRAKREIGSQRRFLPGERRLDLDSQVGRAKERRSCELVVGGEEVLVALKPSQSVLPLAFRELSERRRKPPTLWSASWIGDHRPQLRTPPVWPAGEPSYEFLGELIVSSKHVPKYAARSRPP